MKDAKEWETGGCQRRLVDSAMNLLSTALAGSGSSGFGLISYGNPPNSSRLLMRAYIYLKINKMKLFMKIVKI